MCNHCHGQGHVQVAEDDLGGPVLMPCPICQPEDSDAPLVREV